MDGRHFFPTSILERSSEMCRLSGAKLLLRMAISVFAMALFLVPCECDASGIATFDSFYSEPLGMSDILLAAVSGIAVVATGGGVLVPLAAGAAGVFCAGALDFLALYTLDVVQTLAFQELDYTSIVEASKKQTHLPPLVNGSGTNELKKVADLFDAEYDQKELPSSGSNWRVLERAASILENAKTPEEGMLETHEGYTERLPGRLARVQAALALIRFSMDDFEKADEAADKSIKLAGGGTGDGLSVPWFVKSCSLLVLHPNATDAAVNAFRNCVVRERNNRLLPLLTAIFLQKADLSGNLRANLLRAITLALGQAERKRFQEALAPVAFKTATRTECAERRILDLSRRRTEANVLSRSSENRASLEDSMQQYRACRVLLNEMIPLLADAKLASELGEKSRRFAADEAQLEATCSDTVAYLKEHGSRAFPLIADVALALAVLAVLARVLRRRRKSYGR